MSRLLRHYMSGAIPWYLAGGILPADCSAAYNAAAAASLADSYINRKTPGIDNAGVVVAPTWDAIYGWLLNGSTQYLTTLKLGGITGTTLIRWSHGLASSADRTLYGAAITGTDNHGIQVRLTNGNAQYFNGGTLTKTSTTITRGILAITSKDAYHDYVLQGAIPAGGSIPNLAMFIGALNLNGTPAQFCAGRIQAFAKYSVALTLVQIQAVGERMKALNTQFIAADGDSIPNGYNGLTAFPTTIGTALGVFAENFCLDSDTLANMITTAPTTVDPAYCGLRRSNVLIVHAGTNDLYAGASGATAYGRMVTYCQAREAVGWKVVAGTCLPRSGGGEPGDFETQRAAFNASIRTNYLTFAHGLGDIAADPRMGDAGDETDLTYYQADRVHPNQAGQNVMAEVFQPVVQSLV